MLDAGKNDTGNSECSETVGKNRKERKVRKLQDGRSGNGIVCSWLACRAHDGAMAKGLLELESESVPQVIQLANDQVLSYPAIRLL